MALSISRKATRHVSQRIFCYAIVFCCTCLSILVTAQDTDAIDDETREDRTVGTVVGGIGDFFGECFDQNGVIAGAVVCPVLAVLGGLTAFVCLVFFV